MFGEDVSDFRYPGVGSTVALPHRLMESGNYTIIAGGSAKTDMSGDSFQDNRDPVGGYFVQLLKVGFQEDPLPLHCNPPPFGHEQLGCANFQWTDPVTGQPQISKRHPGCLLHYPFTRIFGGTIPRGRRTFWPAHPHIFYDESGRNTGDFILTGGRADLWIHDFQAPTSGWYTLRVRGAMNSCEHNQGGYCRPEAGPFDLMAKVAGEPLYVSSPPPPFMYGARADASRQTLVPGTPKPITHLCGDATSNPDELCWSYADVGWRPRACDKGFEWIDGTDAVDPRLPYDQTSLEYVARTEATFIGTAGQVICLSARGAPVYELRTPADTLELFGPSGERVAMALRDLSGGSEYTNGFGLSAITLPSAGEYVVRLSDDSKKWIIGTHLLNTTVTLDTSEACVSRKVVLGSTKLPAGCEERKAEAGWDVCWLPRRVDFSLDRKTASFTGGSSTVRGKVGVDMPHAQDTGKYYWEVTLDGNRTYDNKVVSVGVSDEGTDLLMAGNDHYLMPGDVIGIAFDAPKSMIWLYRNGVPLPSGAIGRDIAGTKYNNFPLAIVPENSTECVRRPYSNRGPTQFPVDEGWGCHPYNDHSGQHACCPLNHISEEVQKCTAKARVSLNHSRPTCALSLIHI